MACLISTGFSRDCRMAVGGIKTLWLANLEQVASFTDSDADTIYDTITMTSTNVFYKFEFEDETGSANQELTVSGSNKYVTQTLAFTLQPFGSGANPDLLAETIRLQAERLALGKFVAIVEDKNGIRSILGMNNGLEASALVKNSGAAPGDSAGWAVTLTGEETEYAPVFDSGGTIPV